jgi:hypothetical protein
VRVQGVRVVLCQYVPASPEVLHDSTFRVYLVSPTPVRDAVRYNERVRIFFF